VASTDVLIAGGRGRRGAVKGDDPEQADQAWSTAWGGGPWAADWAGGSWATESGNCHGIGALANGVNRPPMWTNNGDDPTGTWTLCTDADGQAKAARGEADRTTTGEPRNTRVGSGSTATPVAAPARERQTRQVRARRHGGRSRTLLVWAIAVVAVTALTAAAVYALTTKHKTAAAPSGAKPVPSQASLPIPTPSAHPGTWQFITTRVADPVPLTLAELFPTHVSVGPRSYLLTTGRTGQSCRSAVFGSRLKATVRAGCSQALRASYLSMNGKRMGTIGVLNLATAAAAAKVGEVVAAPGQFIQPLPAAHGVSKNLGKGTGVVWAVAKGHYLILMWAQYADLRSPITSNDRKVLLEFVNDLYQKTVNQSLTRRMVTGNP
jgi:hypothetical protein